MEITLPCDSDIESILLSCALNSSQAAVYVFSETSVEDYYFPRHRLLFLICKELYNKNIPLDANLIFTEIKSQGKTHEISLDELFSIIQIAPLSTVWEDYGDKLKNLSILRKVIYASKSALTDASQKDATSDDVINILQDKLLQAQGNELKTCKSLKEIEENFGKGMNFSDHLDWIINEKLHGRPPYEGISSGYKILDETLGFFRNGCIYFIGARTSMGKTTFILNLMHNIKEPIGFFSLEMPANIIAAKLFCIGADIKYSHYDDGILYPEKVERLKVMIGVYKSREIYIEDPSSISISQLRARAKRMKSIYGIKILFIDYLTRIRGTKHANKHLEVDEISKGLQSLAKELDMPIICLAQLNRQSGKDSENKGKPPSLTDFRESGSIEEDADACLLIHRHDYYNKNDKPGVIEVKVAKNRLRGIIKSIEFSCNYLESDRYNELPEINQYFKNQNENEECDQVLNSIRGK
jgi:replicative DNA helicase